MTYSIERARQDLGRRLREIRRSAGLTGVQLAELLAWSQSKISKIETGRQAPEATEIAAWTRICGREDQAADLATRLTELESMWVAWKDQLHHGHSGIQARIANQEKQVRVFRGYEPMLVPGLFQTPDYARAVLESASRKNRSTSDVEDAVQRRIQRQDVLYRRDKSFRYLVSEAALHHRRGDRDTMAAQMDRLITLSRLSNVSFGIIPFDSSPPYLPNHGFWIQDETTVVVETISAELTLTHDVEVEQYLHVFQMASSGACFNDKARALLGRAAKQASA
ncbi:helix-turn-helix domain-containing protein [Nocardiopsis valliformis]|uniref:helix-turn-helix domain-containing protein n=1 Tax=Nocardiopsis valliformis TaxID=239974 RepID=UPI00034A8939|nr:helix-turn-helix transcriptional regulator [Nocardiopsis valliformis]